MYYDDSQWAWFIATPYPTILQHCFCKSYSSSIDSSHPCFYKKNQWVVHPCLEIQMNWVFLWRDISGLRRIHHKLVVVFMLYYFCFDDIINLPESGVLCGNITEFGVVRDHLSLQGKDDLQPLKMKRFCYAVYQRSFVFISV